MGRGCLHRPGVVWGTVLYNRVRPALPPLSLTLFYESAKRPHERSEERTRGCSRGRGDGQAHWPHPRALASLGLLSSPIPKGVRERAALPHGGASTPSHHIPTPAFTGRFFMEPP